MCAIITLCSFLLIASSVGAQTIQFPFIENFDSVISPALPPGWSTTTNRASGGDFTTTRSSPYSDSNAVISTNAAVGQILTSRNIDFSAEESESLSFYERRSGTHNSGVLVEASTDGGTTFPILIGDTLKNPGVTSYISRVFSLPSSLGNQPAVKFRWRVLGNGTGTSGTIRFDDMMITARGQIDAAVDGMTFTPSSPIVGDSVGIDVSIQNAGTHQIPGIRVEFFEDVNNDSIPQEEERFSTVFIDQPIEADQKTIAHATRHDVPAGRATILAKLFLDGDQNPMNNTGRAVLAVGVPLQSIVINEIMYDPLPGNAEYVELYNRASYRIDIREWKLSDIADTALRIDAHTITRSSLTIPAKGFLVIASDSSIFGSFSYISGSAYHVIVRKSGVSLNNSGDNVILIDFGGRVIDSIYYRPSWHNPDIDEVSG